MRPTGEVRCAFAAMLGLFIAAWGGGCGKASQANHDGGDGSISPGDAFGGGKRSFDVVAVLRGTGIPSGNPPPPSNTFTLVLDVDARQAIAGGNGRASVVGITSSDGRTFRSSDEFSVGDASQSACSGQQDVHYQGFEVTVSGGALTGSATGVADISCGDCSFTVPFAATLTGSADKTRPTLHISSAVPVTPFDGFNLTVSEPLPATATARLVGADGTGVDMVPVIGTGAVPLIAEFSKPDVVLRSGQAYFVTLDGLVDFAGNAAVADPPLGLAAFPMAPLVAEDGFESATGTTLGGAMVVTGGAALPVISGSTSLYIGTPGAPGLDVSNGRSLAVHLARQAGDTMLRFSYRIVGTSASPSFPGNVRVGSEGASPGQVIYSFTTPTATDTLTIGGQPAYAGVATTMTVALPGDATDQVLVDVTPEGFLCGLRGITTGGLLIDDLRLE